MTDEERAELRSGIDVVVRAATDGMVVKYGRRIYLGGRTIGHTVRVASYEPSRFDDLPPLTTAQQLALSVLLDEAPANVLAEYMLDQGHEYAVAVAEKARKDELERCVAHLHKQATAYRDYGERDATAVLRHAALSITQLHEVTA